MLLCLLLISLIFARCYSHKKVVYNIPPNYPPEEKKVLLANLDRGRVLYKENCSECHGIFKKGKDGIPNFSKQQLDAYNAKFIRGDAKNHAVARQMSLDQMNSILMFLRFHKLDGDTTGYTPDRRIPIMREHRPAPPQGNGN
jgi:cytochrome c553